MTGRSQAPIRGPRYFSIRAIMPANIPISHLASYVGFMQADAYADFGRADHRGRLLVACTAQVLRPRKAQQAASARALRRMRTPVGRGGKFQSPCFRVNGDSAGCQANEIFVFRAL
jgi:hypothetical protein